MSFNTIQLEETQNRFLPPSWEMISAYAQLHLSSHSSHICLSLHLLIEFQTEQQQKVKNKTWTENTQLIVHTIKKQNKQLPFVVLQVSHKYYFFLPDVSYIFHLHTTPISKKNKHLQFMFSPTYMVPHKVFGPDLIMNLVELIWIFSFWLHIFKWITQVYKRLYFVGVLCQPMTISFEKRCNDVKSTIHWHLL